MGTPSSVGRVVPLLLLGLTGCQSPPGGSTALPPPLPPGGELLISAETAAAGRKLYLMKCARCHKFYPPAQYSASEWQSWMDKMSRKAKLQPDQTALLTEYLDVYRAPQNRTNAVAVPR